MKFFLPLFCCLFGYSVPKILEDGREIVGPEHLISLLKDKNYEEFGRLTAIDNLDLLVPRDENDKTDPRYNRHLENGDFLLTPEQKKLFQGRNAINPTKYPSYKWKSSTVHYELDSNSYTPKEQSYIHKCIAKCNVQFQGCVKLVWYYNATQPVEDYVLISNQNGCWSYIGRIGGQQAMSLQQPGCLSEGTICHEFIHALGFAHEHSRSDRDNNIQMLWENINKGWESQFDIANPNYYHCYLSYDYCSIMHYPRTHPDLCKPETNAFDFKNPDNCTYTIGYSPVLSQLDTQKICAQYPKNG